MNAGDMLGSGTISGPDPDSLACMLEITERGSKPLTTGGGNTRVWIEDGDVVDMYARIERTGDDGEVANVGFGVCSGAVRAATS
jgi:fumarylacetoacetase